MPVSRHKEVSGHNDPLAVYVHWPFCLAKCPYCDFNSHVRASIDEEAFADALCRELDHYADRVGPRDITSIFFGGGTPSLMSPKTVGRVLDKIAACWRMTAGVEITLEANPTSVEAEKFQGFSEAGVNRVSLGVQALNDVDLKALGREHSVKEALAAVELAGKYFTRRSFDLIYAREGQDTASWEVELCRAIDLAAGHLSLYQLTIEENTAFFNAWRRGKLTLPEEEISAEMFDLTRDICADRGLPAYEVSNHAKLGEESRHNLTYWRYGDYVGVGPGAHGRVSLDGDLVATVQTRKPEDWLKKPLELEELLDVQMQAEEMIMMGLRLTEGICRADFDARIGRPLEEFINQEKQDYLRDAGFLTSSPTHLCLSGKGMPLLNQVLAQLLVG